MATYDDIEAVSLAELRAVQRERLKWSLAHAYNGNPAYCALFDAAGVKPDDCKSLDDLARFPFTSKSNLRDAYPFGFFAVPMNQVARLHASSGTTGKPTVVAYTKKDIATWAQVMARSIHAAGGRPGMKVHVAYGYGLFTGGLGAHYGAELLGCAVIPMSGGQTEKQVQLITDFQPEVIMATPSYTLAILDEFRRQGLDPKASSLKIGLMGAEPWTEKMRAEIEAGFAMQALDIYGLSEVIGPGVAQEYADTRDGLTIWEDHFYPEVVDPTSGEVLPEGQEGELVLTSLTKEAMPVIRYRTRDLVKLLPGTGRAMRRMTRVTGRSDDMLLIRGVNVFPSQVEEQVLRCADLAPLYLIEVGRPARLDEICVRVELRPGSAATREAVAQELHGRIKDNIGVTAKVEVSPPNSLERSQGKAKRVIDLRPKT
ncbi:MAG: phenylacetate--CoA ligase [Rhodospirillaceae bacterium]|nr:phenylacetate--CoA ligase [Rhodospirillaceae bacterium]